jgi:hypothetical protein
VTPRDAGHAQNPRPLTASGRWLTWVKGGFFVRSDASYRRHPDPETAPHIMGPVSGGGNMRATIRSLGVVSLAALAAAAKGRAQVKVEFTPLAGAYMPTAALFRAGTVPHAPSARLRQETGLALGGQVTAWVTDRVAVEGSFGHSGSGVELTASFNPYLDRCCADVTSRSAGHVSMVSARLLLVVVGRPSSRALYILGGPVYVDHGDQGFNPCPNCFIYYTTVGMFSSLGAVVGIGARFKVPRTALAVRTELEDCRYEARFSAQAGSDSWSSSRVQNDLLLSLGLSVHPSDGASARQR